MKRCIGFFLFLTAFLLISIDISLAQESDIILKISSETNAHGEVYNEAGNYPVEVLFSDFFTEGSNERQCKSDRSNVILRLSGTTNAHAEGPQQSTSGYQDVCYGDLSCSLKSSCDANNGEMKILGLSGTTNAHLESAGQNNYANFLCCTLGEIIPENPEITRAEWHGNSGNQITETYISRTVNVYAEISDYSGEVNFLVWDDDDNNGRFDSGDDIISNLIVQINNGVAETEIEITEEIIDDADDGFDCNNGLEFYFNASISGSSKLSGKLKVHCQEGPNQRPEAVITAPVHRQMYFVNTLIEFNHSSFDLDEDELTYSWQILGSDGTVEHTTQQESFHYTFNSLGERVVTLVVSDGQYQDADRVGILVVGSPGIFAYINKPEFSSVVENLNKSKKVDFSGSDSYVVNFPQSSCSMTGSCLAGYCPDETYNPPSGCTNNISIPDAPQNPENSDYSELEFTWEFSDENQLISLPPANNFPEGWVAYNKPSNQFNDKTGKLTLNYNENNLQLTQESRTQFTLGRCLNNGNSYLGSDGIIRSTSKPNVCQGDDGILYSEGGQYPDCCPANEFCTLDENDDFRCMISEIASCSEYTTKSECESDSYDIADDDPAAPDQCPDPNDQFEGAKCYWETNGTSETSDDKCGIKAICSEQSGGPGDEHCENLVCNYIYEQTECVGGYMDIIYRLGQYEPYNQQSHCIDYPRTQEEYEASCSKETIAVPCGRISFELSFFDYFQFIITSIIILVIYVIWISKNGKR